MIIRWVINCRRKQIQTDINRYRYHHQGKRMLSSSWISIFLSGLYPHMLGLHLTHTHQILPSPPLADPRGQQWTYDSTGPPSPPVISNSPAPESDGECDINPILPSAKASLMALNHFLAEMSAQSCLRISCTCRPVYVWQRVTTQNCGTRKTSASAAVLHGRRCYCKDSLEAFYFIHSPLYHKENTAKHMRYGECINE